MGLPVRRFSMGTTATLCIAAATTLLAHHADAASRSDLAAATGHVVAVAADDTLWAWGTNTSGQLGDGTRTARSAPAQVGDSPNWRHVAAGGGFTLAIRRNGSLWAWGENSDGQLGDGTTEDRLVPTQVHPPGEWTQVAAGWTHTIALRRDGTLWAWGRNLDGELGYDTTADGDPVHADIATLPQQVGTARDWAQVRAGGSFSAAIKTDGTLWLWGDNRDGQLGNGSRTDPLTGGQYAPQQVGSDADWIDLQLGTTHVVALKQEGMLWAWGDNFGDQLGYDTSTDNDPAHDTVATIPQQVGEVRYRRIGAGSFHSFGVRRNGSAQGWGENHEGQLGAGYVSATELAPVPLAVHTTWDHIAGGASFSVGVTEDGDLFAWGRNSNGQLGNGTLVSNATPQEIPHLQLAARSTDSDNGYGVGCFLSALGH